MVAETIPGNSRVLRERRAAYLFLFSIQFVGAIFVIIKGIPVFNQLALYPGEQLPYLRSDDYSLVAATVVMQLAYWYRLLRVRIPFLGSTTILSHLFLFLGRLNFIFGGSLFAVVFFRHFPELGQSADILLMARRSVSLVGALFALFCFTLELERLGAALGRDQQN